jgi:hypothetical protein
MNPSALGSRQKQGLLACTAVLLRTACRGWPTGERSRREKMSSRYETLSGLIQCSHKRADIFFYFLKTFQSLFSR